MDLGLLVSFCFPESAFYICLLKPVVRTLDHAQVCHGSCLYSALYVLRCLQSELAALPRRLDPQLFDFRTLCSHSDCLSSGLRCCPHLCDCLTLCTVFWILYGVFSCFWASQIRYSKVRIRIQIQIVTSSSKNIKKTLDFHCFVTSL